VLADGPQQLGHASASIPSRRTAQTHTTDE
jgi:hypothetical protein